MTRETLIKNHFTQRIAELTSQVNCSLQCRRILGDLRVRASAKQRTRGVGVRQKGEAERRSLTLTAVKRKK